VNRGRFIVFEGGEASGKSTQAARLAADLDAVLTREPGGTDVGSRIRELFLDPAITDLDPRAEALLAAADRAQHVARVVEPALASGRDVVSDRYVPSSLAYQGYGRGLDIEHVRQMSVWATGGLEPDVVILLDVPPDVSAERLQGRDRMEAAGDEFHRRVREGYRDMAEVDPERWLVVDATGPIDEVATRVRDAFDKWMAAAGR